MGWTKFTEGGRSFAARATISANGSLSFSEGACERFGIKEAEAVVLYFDSEERRVGIELVDDLKAEGARKIRKRRMGADVAAKPFLDKFDIYPTTTTLYTLDREADTGFLVLHLPDGKTRKSRGKSQKVIDA